MPDLPLDPRPDRSNDELGDLQGYSMPQHSQAVVGDAVLAADFADYRESVGAEHQFLPRSPAWKLLRAAICRVGELFDVPLTASPEERVERVSPVCATGGMTNDGRQGVVLIEGIVSSANKFGLPTGSLKHHIASPNSSIVPVDMPPVEVLDEAAGVVVSVDWNVSKAASLALILTGGAFEQALSHLLTVSEFLDARNKENPHALTFVLPYAASIFALLLNEVRNRETSILGVKRLVGPSKNRVFQLSVLSLTEGQRSSSIIAADGVVEATHHIQVTHNDFGIVESHWLGRSVASSGM